MNYYFNIQQYNRCVNESLTMLEPYEDNKMSTIFIVYQNTLVCYYPDELERIIYPSERTDPNVPFTRDSPERDSPSEDGDTLEDVFEDTRITEQEIVRRDMLMMNEARRRELGWIPPEEEENALPFFTAKQRDSKLYVWRTGQDAIIGNSIITNRIIGFSERGSRANLDFPVYKIDYINLFVDGTDLKYCFDSQYNTYFILDDPETKFIGTQSQIEPIQTLVYRILPISRIKYVFDNKISYLDNQNVHPTDKYDDEKELDFPIKIPFTPTEWDLAIEAINDYKEYDKKTVSYVKIKNLKISIKSVDRINSLLFGGQKEFSLVNRENIFYLEGDAPVYKTPRRELTFSERRNLESIPKSTVPMYSAKRAPYIIQFDDKNLNMTKQELLLFLQKNSDIENLIELIIKDVHEFEIRTRKNGSRVASEYSTFKHLPADMLTSIYKYVDHPFAHDTVPQHKKYFTDHEIRTDFPILYKKYLDGEVSISYIFRYRYKFDKTFVVNLIKRSTDYKLFLTLFFTNAMVGCTNLVLNITEKFKRQEKEMLKSLPPSKVVVSLTPENKTQVIVEYEWDSYLDVLNNFKSKNTEWMFSIWLIQNLTNKNLNFYHPLLYNIILISTTYSRANLLSKFFEYQQRLDPKWRAPYFPLVITSKLIPILEEHKIDPELYSDSDEIYSVRKEIHNIQKGFIFLRSFAQAPHQIKELADEGILQEQFNHLLPSTVPEFNTVEEANKYLERLKDTKYILKQNSIYDRKDYYNYLRRIPMVMGRNQDHMDDMGDLELMNAIGDANNRWLDFHIEKIYNLVREEEVDEKVPEQKQQSSFVLPANWREMEEETKLNLLLKLESFYINKFINDEKDNILNSIRRMIRDLRNEFDFNRMNSIETIIRMNNGDKEEKIEDIVLENLPFQTLMDMRKEMRVSYRIHELLKILNRYTERRPEFTEDAFAGKNIVNYENANIFTINNLIDGIKTMRRFMYASLGDGDMEFLNENQLEEEEGDRDAIKNPQPSEQQYIIKDNYELRDIIRQSLVSADGFPLLPNFGEFNEDFRPPALNERVWLGLSRRLTISFMMGTEEQKQEYLKYLIENIRLLIPQIVNRQNIPVFMFSRENLSRDEQIEELLEYKYVLTNEVSASIFALPAEEQNVVRNRLIEEIRENIVRMRAAQIDEDAIEHIEYELEERGILAPPIELINKKYMSDLILRIYG